MDDPSLSSPRGSEVYPPNPLGIMVKEILQDLSLQEDELLVDLTCVDGSFAEAILQEVDLSWQIIGVQASQDLLLAATGHVGIRPVPMDLEAFAHFPLRYHKAFMRVDILPSLPPVEILSRLHHQVIPAGRLVAVTSAPGDDVPLPAAAVRRWEESRPSGPAIVEALEAAGFSARGRSVQVACHTPVAECLEWVETRAWPILEDLSEEELAGGLSELRSRLGGQGSVSWSTRFDLVTGTKAGDRPS